MTTSEKSSHGEVTPQWRDRKRYLWLFGLVAPTSLGLAAVLVWACHQLGWDRPAAVWWWIGPLLVYVLLPILDRFFGPDGQNPPDEVMEQLQPSKLSGMDAAATIAVTDLQGEPSE